jgi:pimeloyl-ACP methyl ester carboxylesterase
MTANRIPVVFIHGLWLHASSWAPWVDLFTEAGYAPVAPGWPGDPETVELARANPDSIAGHGIDDVKAHHAGLIERLPAPPIIIGHSFGGMIAEKLLGGDPVGPAGLALPPQVLAGGNDVATAREEVFGPAITIVEARDGEEALRLANDTEYGLSSAVHTADAERGTRFALRLNVGMTHVNDSPVNEEDNTAYGGEKLSGLGRFGGSWSVDEFTTHYWVSVQHTRRPYPMPTPA